MDALIDTNVLINYVTNREDPYKEAPSKSWNYAAKAESTAAWHSTHSQHYGMYFVDSLIILDAFGLQNS